MDESPNSGDDQSHQRGQRVHLKREIGNLLAVVGEVFDQARPEAGLSLEHVELSIEISSEGQISILGSGGKRKSPTV